MSYKKCFSPCDECRYSYSKNNQKMSECDICEFNYYKNLEYQGRLIELPCTVGDTVWVITCCNDVVINFDWETGYTECPFENECEFEDCSGTEDKLKIFKTSIEGYVITKQGIALMLHNIVPDTEMSDIGKRLFFTPAEAEAKLAEMEGAE